VDEVDEDVDETESTGTNSNIINVITTPNHDIDSPVDEDSGVFNPPSSNISAPTPSTSTVVSAPKTNYCYRYAEKPTRTLFYRSNDCAEKWGWGFKDKNVGKGGSIKGYTTQQPNTQKYCYRYAEKPTRTLFYKSNDCTSKWGWDFKDKNVGSGGEVWLYPNQQPNTQKYCYRYAEKPTRTLFYKSNDCTSKWGWNFKDKNVGSGGEVWVPNA
jgi:hypothetical protein